MKRCALYTRVSTTDQDCAMQLAELRRYCELRDWTIVAEFVEHGVSGATRSRPQLDKLLTHAKDGKFDVVLVWRFDRMARSLTHLIEVLETLQAHKTQFCSKTEDIDTGGATGRLMFSIIAAFSQFERDLIRERSAAGMAVARANGTRFGRPEKHDLPIAVIEEALRVHGGQRQAAKALGVPAATLRYRLRQIAPTPNSQSQEQSQPLEEVTV